MTPPSAVNKVNRCLTAIYRVNDTQVQGNILFGGKGGTSGSSPDHCHGFLEVIQ
jgi:hypothetical protein